MYYLYNFVERNYIYAFCFLLNASRFILIINFIFIQFIYLAILHVVGNVDGIQLVGEETIA